MISSSVKDGGITLPRFPKDPPVKDPEFMTELKKIIGRCEHPGGCAYSMRLDCHHIKGRGLGGGSRKDTEDNLIILCRAHHNTAHSLGVPYRPTLVDAMKYRTESEKRKIRGFLRKRSA